MQSLVGGERERKAEREGGRERGSTEERVESNESVRQDVTSSTRKN